MLIDALHASCAVDACGIANALIHATLVAVSRGTGSLRFASTAAPSDVLTSAAWTNKPSWQIRPLDPDRPLEELRFEAERAHSTVIELKSLHAIPVTFPDVVDVIKQAARAIADEQWFVEKVSSL